MFSALPWRCCLNFLCHMCKIMFVFCRNMICWPILAQLQILHKLLNLGFFCLYLHPQIIPNSHPHFPKVMSPSLPGPSFPPIFRRPQDLCFTSMAWFQSSRSSRWHHRGEWVDLKFSEGSGMTSVLTDSERIPKSRWALEKGTDSFLNMAILSIYAKFLGFWGGLKGWPV